MNYLFTTPSCPYCPRAKRLLEESPLSYELIDASKPAGITMARRFNISSVPSLLVTDEAGEKTCLLSGIEEITNFKL